MIYREGKAGQERNYDAALPRCPLAVRLDDPMYERVADPVLNLDLVHNSSTRSEELAIVPTQSGLTK